MSDSQPIASRICLGTAQIGSDYGVANARGRPDDAMCDALLSRAIERGVLRWDTARSYGDAEQRIGNFLANCPRRDEVQLVSKLPAPPPGLPPAKVLDWVTAEIDSSLRDLRIDRLAAWLVHDADAVRVYGDAIWDAMRVQVERGTAEQIGLSVYDLDELRWGLDRPNAGAVQLTINLFDSRFTQSGMLDECLRRDMTVYARSVLLQGVLTMAADRLPAHLAHFVQPLEKLHQILSNYDLGPLDIALPFVLSHAQVDYAVIGVDDISQLNDNLARAEKRLPDGLAEELHAAFGNLPVEVLEPRRWE